MSWSIRKTIAGHGITMPARIISSDEPIAVFDYAATVSSGLGELIEADMTGQGRPDIRSNQRRRCPTDCSAPGGHPALIHGSGHGHDSRVINPLGPCHVDARPADRQWLGPQVDA